MHMVNELCGSATRPMLVDMSTTTKVSRGAREVFSRPCQASPIALVGVSPVDQVVANFVLARNKTRPKRFFTSRAEAMIWLKKSTQPNPDAKTSNVESTGPKPGQTHRLSDKPANERRTRRIVEAPPAFLSNKRGGHAR